MKIYLATPYSHNDHIIRNDRFLNINKVALYLLNNGYFIYSPITHCHPIAEIGNLPKDWDFWKKYDECFLEWCDELWIYCANGWDYSLGIKCEIKIAKELSKPIKYIDDNILK